MSSRFAEALRFAVIGVGAFGSRRAEAIYNLKGKGLKLEWVVDLNAELAESLAREFGCRWSTNWKDLKAANLVDCAVIATPNHLKAEIMAQLVELGIHILCEKPLALDVDQIESISRNYPDVVVKTGSNHRYFPHVLEVKNLLESGAIGTPKFARGVIGNNGAKLQDSWMTNSKLSGGGSFIDNGCHLLDLACWFFGEPAECTGYIQNRPRAIGIENLGMAIYQMQSGVLVSVHSSWMEWNGYMSFEIYGDDGFINLDARGNNCRVSVGGKHGVEKTFDFTGLKFSSLEDELLHFVSMVLEGVEVSPNVYEGYRVVRMARALYESADTSKSVVI